MSHEIKGVNANLPTASETASFNGRARQAELLRLTRYLETFCAAATYGRL